jgi:uncharacterized protein YjbI with pentapeptide repeats
MRRHYREAFLPGRSFSDWDLEGADFTGAFLPLLPV